VSPTILPDFNLERRNDDGAPQCRINPQNRKAAAHQVGSGSGFWKEKHRLETRLSTARALRDVISEAAE